MPDYGRWYKCVRISHQLTRDDTVEIMRLGGVVISRNIAPTWPARAVRRIRVSMTPSDLAQARKRLGLTLEQMATLLGYQGSDRRTMMHKIERGIRPLREPQRLLVVAYLSGYRPEDWPHGGM